MRNLNHRLARLESADARPPAVVPDDPRELVRAILAGRVTHADLTLDQLSWLARGVARARQHNFEKERDNG